MSLFSYLATGRGTTACTLVFGSAIRPFASSLGGSFARDDLAVLTPPHSGCMATRIASDTCLMWMLSPAGSSVRDASFVLLACPTRMGQTAIHGTSSSSFLPPAAEDLLSTLPDLLVGTWSMLPSSHGRLSLRDRFHGFPSQGRRVEYEAASNVDAQTTHNRTSKRAKGGSQTDPTA